MVAAARETLGRDLLGAYLFGSATLGGLRPRSDLDVFGVSRRTLADGERRRLVERLLAVSGRPARPVELTIVVQDEVRPWRYPPRRDFQYGEWLRAGLERGELDPVRPTVDRDLAMLLPLVLRADHPLLGPPPAALLDAVPHEDYVRAIVDDLDAIRAGLEETDDTRNVVLTLARIWSTLATREIRSKDAAADWALDRLPEEHRAVLRRARAVYLGRGGRALGRSRCARPAPRRARRGGDRGLPQRYSRPVKRSSFSKRCSASTRRTVPERERITIDSVTEPSVV